MPVFLVGLIAVLALGLGSSFLMRGGAPAPAPPAPDTFAPEPPEEPAPAMPNGEPTALPKDRIFNGLGASDEDEAAGSQAAGSPAAVSPAAASQGSGVVASEQANEKQFLAQYDGAVRNYQRRLNEIGMRYYKKCPIVREVDSAFANLPRYMAIQRRYNADRDLYKWARDTAALPEVRTTIKKYLARPEAWTAAVDMMLEALKQPPPAPVYQEVARFMTHDPGLVDLTTKVLSDAKPNLTTGVVALAGKDLTPLQGVIKDLSLDKNPSR